VIPVVTRDGEVLSAGGAVEFSIQRISKVGCKVMAAGAVLSIWAVVRRSLYAHLRVDGGEFLGVALRALAPGARFEILEGNRRIGTGVVL
jgi:hypothetical protein